jgi:hypothetical protein
MSLKAKLEECRYIIHETCCDVEGRYPFGLIRVGRLLEEMLEECGDEEWSWDDIISIPIGDRRVGDLNPEPPFPAA